MNRREALAANAKRYTGRPCHIHGQTERYTTSAHCVECARLSVGARMRAKRDAIKLEKMQVSSGFSVKLSSSNEPAAPTD